MNLPNKISLFRLFLVPVIVLVKIFPYAQFGISLGAFHFSYVSLPVLNVILLVLYAVGSFSDFLDGQIARRRNMVTTFGKFIDPIADKALTTTMFLILAADGLIPLFVVWVFVVRDICVDGMRMVASGKGVVAAAGFLGKAKTATQMIATILILLNNLPFELAGIPMADIVLWAAVLLSAVSGFDYYKQYRPVLLESK